VALEVTRVDERAGENPQGVRYGFVEFNDDTRLAFTDEGVRPDVTGGAHWGPVTAAHAKLAHDHLTAMGNMLGTRVKTAE
jgi:hypothetical protein